MEFYLHGELLEYKGNLSLTSSDVS